MARSGRVLRRWTAVVLVVALLLAGLPAAAFAQSPSPGWYAFDSRPGNGFPPTAPYASHAPNAVVVEGLGSLGCSGSYFSQVQIQSQTVSWINSGVQTITEISPQAYWGSLSQYYNLLIGIESYVETYGSNPGRYWGGFMLDEEPNFDFSATDLITLNKDAENIMSGTPGGSWVFTEDQPNGWSLSTYNQILQNTWAAPQVYTSPMLNAANNECSTYSQCVNMVTIESQWPYPWDDYLQIIPQVNGSPMYLGYWGSGYWFNEFRSQ